MTTILAHSPKTVNAHSGQINFDHILLMVHNVPVMMIISVVLLALTAVIGATSNPEGRPKISTNADGDLSLSVIHSNTAPIAILIPRLPIAIR